MWERQRTKQDGVDDTKNGCVRANAKRKRQYRDCRKAWGFAERAQGVADIAAKIIEVGFPAGVAYFFFNAV